MLLLLAFLVYLILSLIYFGPSSINKLNSYIFNNSSDPQQFIWYYGWWPYAITHHLNPFISKYVWFPKGYNVAWSTSIPTLSLLMLPVTLFGNAILSYNLVALLSPVLAATAMFALVYYLTKKYWAAVLSGYIYGFSSFMLGQLLGHPQQYAIFLLPMIVLLYILLLKTKIKPLYFVIFTSLLLVLQTGISLEITMTFMLFGALFWILSYYLTEYRLNLKASFKYIIYTLLTYVILLSPFIFYLLKGLHNLPKTIHPLIPFSLNVANLFIPTPLTLIGGSQLTNLTHFFIGNMAENGAYLGLVLLLLLLFIAIKYWQYGIYRVLTLCLILIGIASLGPRLHLLGQTGASIWMPWALMAKIPLIRDAQPDRFALYFFFLTAITVGLWLAIRPKSRRHSQIKYLVVTIGILLLIPNVSVYSWTKTNLPTIFQKQNFNRYLGAKPNILILPFDSSGIYYQYATGMSFTQATGYVGFIPKNYAISPVISAFKTGNIPNNFNALFSKFVKSNKISKIIIFIPQTQTSIINAIHDLHWQERQVGNSILVIPKND